jgi:Spy/CpxP family protein refolding chaperone
LQKALAEEAPLAEINAAVAKVQAVRRQREADMLRTQSDLREVLTPKRAAALVASGILD